MLEVPKRHSLRKGTCFSKTVPKGFLKIAREKLNRQMTVREGDKEQEARKHSHKRSKSSSLFEMTTDGSRSPNFRFISQPQGDF